MNVTDCRQRVKTRLTPTNPRPINKKGVKTMTDKDYTMYGTKIYNHKKQEVGLLISTWVNVYADDKVDFATCVDSKGNKYNTAMDNISPVED